jgi:hypothetical protein
MPRADAMRQMLKRVCWIVVAACGGSSGPRAPHAPAIRLEPVVAEQTWYRTTTVCGQGPYEVELSAAGAKWGEEVELLVHAPHAIELRAEVIADGKEVAHTSFGSAPANARCVADAHERLALGTRGTGAGTPVDVTPGRMVVPPPEAPQAPAELVVETRVVTTSQEVLRFRVPDHAAPTLRIRFWSVLPNDLEGVLFGAAHVVWRPNVPEERYEAYLVEQVEAARVRAEREAAEWQRTHHSEDKVVVVDMERERAREARRIAAEAERARRAAEDERRAQIAAALEAERQARRAAYCAAHPGDRDCWGAGGLRVHLDLEKHQRERDAYCAVHAEDARCWTDEERARRHAVWNARIDAALAPACQPTTAPPGALAESQPPKLSLHAEWRQGYWQWTECTWVWLAGMWRVPDSDIVAGTTTTAPTAPPALQVEVTPPSPVRTAVWVPGFWQWSGTTWVWITGSWQLRPATTMTWRPAEWRATGSLHVLVPGGWIHVR